MMGTNALFHYNAQANLEHRPGDGRVRNALAYLATLRGCDPAAPHPSSGPPAYAFSIPDVPRSPDEIKPWDTDVRPDGKGLPERQRRGGTR